MQMSDREFLRAAYAEVFGRPPDVEGFEHYLRKLTRLEVDRNTVISEMLNSEEFAIQLVERGRWHGIKVIASVAPKMLLQFKKLFLSTLPRNCNVIERLKTLTYFQDAELPNITSHYDVYHLRRKSDRRIVAKRYGLKTKTIRSETNILYMHRNAKRFSRGITFSFWGKNNTIVIDENCGLCGTIHFHGDRNLVVFFGGQERARLSAGLYHNSILIWGKKAFAYGVNIAVADNTVCTIGDDCLFSEGIDIRTTDHHSIIDLASFEVLKIGLAM